MPQFDYSPYRSPFSGTLSQLLGQEGDIRAKQALAVGNAQAQGTQQSGAIWANTLNNVGAIAGHAAQEYGDPRRQADEIHLQQLKQQQAGQGKVDALMQGDQLPPGAVGPRQPTYTDAHGLWDIPALSQELGKMGAGHLAPDLLKGAEAMNESILKHEALAQKTADAHTVLLGDMADSVTKLASIGVPVLDAMDFISGPVIARKQINPQEYAQVRGHIASLPPEQQKAALATFVDAAARIMPKKTLAEGAQEIDAYNRVSATNPKVEKKADYTIEGQRFSGDTNAPIGTRLFPQATPKSLQSENEWQVNDPKAGWKSTPVIFDPATGARYLTEADVAAKKPIDPASLRKIPAAARGQSDGNTTGGGLTEGSVDYLGTQYRILGPSGIPTRFDQGEKTKIVNRSTEQIAALGQSPVQAVQKQLAVQADSKALALNARMATSAEAFEYKALQQADIVTGLSKNVSRTDSPLFNSALLAGKKEIFGDADTQLLFNAVQTFTSEYAKIMEGSTGSVAASSDSARKAADRLVKAGLGHDTLLKTIDLMRREMRLTILGYDAVREHIMSRLGDGGVTGATPAATAPAGPPRIYYDATGKPVSR